MVPTTAIAPHNEHGHMSYQLPRSRDFTHTVVENRTAEHDFEHVNAMYKHARRICFSSIVFLSYEEGQHWEPFFPLTAQCANVTSGFITIEPIMSLTLAITLQDDVLFIRQVPFFCFISHKLIEESCLSRHFAVFIHTAGLFHQF